MKVIIGELKKRVAAVAAKVKKYQGRMDRFRQSGIFHKSKVILILWRIESGRTKI